MNTTSRRNLIAGAAAVVAGSLLPSNPTRRRWPTKKKLGAAIGQRIARAREWRQLSIADLASASGLSESKLSAVEGGNLPEADDLNAIGKGMRVSCQWLFTGSKKPGEIPPDSV